MMTITATFDLTMLYFVAANVVAILLYVLYGKRRSATAKRDLAAITAAIAEFFRDNDEQVAIECVPQPGRKRFVALIDSMPSKRFRYSHIVAEFLCNHVRKACGLELARVYWRFPMRAASRSPASPEGVGEVASRTPGGDDYLDLGVAHLRNLPRYEVTEDSWENFRELVEDGKSRA